MYGFLSPIFATFDAVGVGKSNPLFHCFYVSYIFLFFVSLCESFLQSHIHITELLRMELGALLKAASPLSATLKMSASTPTFPLWMILEPLALMIVTTMK